jgi:GR25 family glycosyltransferase involved in LPS biosynthesis
MEKASGDLPSSWSEVCSSKAVMMGLKRYAFRREYSAAKLGMVGIKNIEFVDSFDGYNDDIDKALENLGIKMNPELGPGHKACSYTHLLEWKRMIDENVPYRMFFEDDVIAHLDLPNGLGQKFWDATPKDFDVLYLGSMLPNNPTVIGKTLDDPNNIIIDLPVFCLHAYILTLEGAKKLWALAKETIATEKHLVMLDMQLVKWQLDKKIKWCVWNATWIQKSYPTFDEGLPWKAFSDIIIPQKDVGLFWQNMRVGTTLNHPTLQITVPQYSL